MTDTRIEEKLYRIAFLVQCHDPRLCSRLGFTVRPRQRGFQTSRCRLSIERICCAAVFDLARWIFRLHHGFLPGSTMKLPKLIGINDHAIDLVENKQTLFGPIYSSEPVELI